MSENVGTTGGTQKPTPPLHRCTRCFAELFEADRGHGSTALACSEHGFDRQILTIPGWVEGSAKDHPKITRRYVRWLLEGNECGGDGCPGCNGCRSDDDIPAENEGPPVQPLEWVLVSALVEHAEYALDSPNLIEGDIEKIERDMERARAWLRKTERI